MGGYLRSAPSARAVAKGVQGFETAYRQKVSELLSEEALLETGGPKPSAEAYF
jgi:hypothetical protein